MRIDRATPIMQTVFAKSFWKLIINVIFMIKIKRITKYNQTYSANVLSQKGNSPDSLLRF